MSGYRFTIDLFVKEPIPTELKDKLPNIREAVRKLKSYASSVGEDIIIKATYHKCHHDEVTNQPCEPEENI